jgi:baculoviral IAP repeat-containing protein 6
MASEIERQYDEWVASTAAADIGVMALVTNENGKLTFDYEGDEFFVHYPPDFPKSSTKLSLSTQSKKLQEWINRINKEIIDANPPTLSLNDLFTKAFKLKKAMSKKSSSSGKKKTKKPSSHNLEMEADELEIDAKELEILKMKKRWRQKEEEIRAQMEKDRLSMKKDSKEERVEKQQIFTSTASSGILTNDLLAIMKDSKKLGYSAEPIDDNIYHWKVLMFGFKPDSNIAKDLKSLKNKWGYDYVEFHITFKINLYPFYPALVRVIRPRFQGFMMGRIVSMEALKLDHWSPTKDMCYYLNMIRELLEEYGRIDVNMPMNDKNNFPAGSYTELEWLLLQLELLSDQSPRANLKYQLKQTSQETVAVTKSTVSTKETKKSGDTKQKTEAHYWAKGTGYGYEGASGTGEWSIQAYLAAQRERDEQYEAVIRKIYECLRKENKDQVTEEEKKSRFLVLEESSLIPVLESFLNNDSLLDMSKHESLYTSLFNIMRALAENEDLVPLLDTLPHQKKSLYDLLAHVHQQAIVYLKTIEKSKSKTDDSLVQNIKQTFAVVDVAVKNYRMSQNNEKRKAEQMTDVGSSTNQTNRIDSTKQKRDDENKLYCEIMKTYQFDYVDLSSGQKYNHYYKASARNFVSNKERVLRLAQETGTLATSLPLSVESSVFVRVDEERMDLMTCLITGPVNTPYSGGCFLFDIFFPEDYPNVPPNVWLMTTGNGTVRFNPNLYDNGKVCLSLLGTWSGAEGENWNKETSTLLQVLVSIQSLILVPDPYFNEPGYERTMHTEEGKRRSREYNENIYEQTIRFAMIGQLRQPPYGYEDVIRAHFYLRKDAILQEINKAIAESLKRGSLGHKSRLESLLKQLKEEIAKLEKSVSKADFLPK